MFGVLIGDDRDPANNNGFVEHLQATVLNKWGSRFDADPHRGRGVNRGDLVTIALPGDFGKPRPALSIQSDQFDQTGTVTVLRISGTLVDAPLIRTTIELTPTNGLWKRSQVMVDKAMQDRREDRPPRFRSHAGADTDIGCLLRYCLIQ